MQAVLSLFTFPSNPLPLNSFRLLRLFSYIRDNHPPPIWLQRSIHAMLVIELHVIPMPPPD